MRARLASESSRERRAQLALELLLRDANAKGGCLLAFLGNMATTTARFLHSTESP